MGNKKSDKIARSIASKAVLGAVGYGLTGEWTGAVAAENAGTATKKKYDELRLSSEAKRRKNETLDAYQDYKEYTGLNSEEMLNKSKELLGKDLDDIDDVKDRNFAAWLQTDKVALEVLGAKDPEKAVLEQLKEYENG